MALENFVTEMKAQGIWNDVVILTISDFGRKLVPNGRGCDHAWGGIIALCFMRKSTFFSSELLPLLTHRDRCACLLWLMLKEITSSLEEDCAEAKCLESSRAVCTPNTTIEISTTVA